MLQTEQSISEDEKRKRIQSSGPTLSFYAPDMNKYKNRLYKTKEKMALKSKRVAFTKKVISEQRLSSRTLLVQNLKVIDDILVITGSPEGDPQDRRLDLRSGIVRTYYVPILKTPLVEMPMMSSSYITQYTKMVLEQEEARLLKKAKIRIVAFKFIVFTALAGFPVITSVALALDPVFVKTLLSSWIPEEWIGYIDSNKTKIVYHALMTVTPLVINPTGFILSSVTENYYLRMFLTTNFTKFGTQTLGSPFLGSIFSNVTYSTIAELANNSKAFILAAKTTEELKEDMIKTAYIENMKRDAEYEKVYSLLSQGLSEKEIDIALGKIIKETFWGKIKKYMENIGSFVSPVTGFIADVVKKNVGKIIFFTGLVGLVSYLSTKLPTGILELLPTISDVQNNINGFFEYVGDYMEGKISLDKFVSWAKSIYPASAMANKMANFLSHGAFPFIMSKLLTLFNVPVLVDKFFAKFPILRKKFGNLPGMKRLREILMRFYGGKIEWDITLGTITSHFLLKTGMSTASSFVEKYIPRGLFTIFFQKLNYSTVTLFMSAATQTAQKIAESTLALKEVEGSSASFLDIWDSLDPEKFFPQFYESIKFIVPDTIFYNDKNEEIYKVINFDNFYLDLQGLGDNAVAGKIRIDLVSMADKTSDFMMKNDLTGEMERLSLESLIQGSMNNILETVVANKGSDSEGGEINRTNLENIFSNSIASQRDSQPILAILKNSAGIDVSKISSLIKEKVSEIKSIDFGRGDRTELSYSTAKKANVEFNNYLLVIENLKNAGEYDEILNVRAKGDYGKKIYEGTEEKLKDIENMVVTIKQDISKNEKLIKNIDDIEEDFNKKIIEQHDKLKNKVVLWAKETVNFLEKRELSRESFASLVPPQLNFSDVEKELSNLREESKMVKNSVGEITEKYRESTITSRQQSSLKRGEKTTKLQEKIEKSEALSKALREESRQKFNEAVTAMGVTNMINFTLGNANVMDMTVLLGMIQKFSEYGDLALSDVPPGMNLNDLDDLSEAAKKRKSLLENILSDSPRELATNCLQTDKYRWDIKTGKPYNLVTSKIDESLNV